MNRRNFLKNLFASSAAVVVAPAVALELLEQPSGRVYFDMGRFLPPGDYDVQIVSIVHDEVMVEASSPEAAAAYARWLYKQVHFGYPGGMEVSEFQKQCRNLFKTVEFEQHAARWQALWPQLELSKIEKAPKV